MQLSKEIRNRFPRLLNYLESGYARLQGLPPIAYFPINKELLRECVGKDDPTILDIGCNDGTHTLWFFEVFKNPKVYCFEPDPRARDRFKANVGQKPNINLFEIAICDRVGTSEFYQSTGHRDQKMADGRPFGWDASGSIREPKDHLKTAPWVKFEQKITVPTSTLDVWSKEQGVETIDFIWMDVQGAEIDVFRGGTTTLSRTRYLYTEYSNRELYKGQFHLKELMNYLDNFQLVIRYPGDVLFRNRQLTKMPSEKLLRLVEESQ